MATDGIDLPFEEAISFFRQKTRIPTERWTDLWQGQHTRGFTVAGAMTDDLLKGFQESIDRAIAEGATYKDFLRDFDQLVERHGWSYNGSRGWRSRTIYQTNLSTAYHAGRYQQMRDPDVMAYRPYWRYRHGDSQEPRQKHLAWDGLVLPADDPWWDSHYPPNGWGCTCYVEAITDRELKAMGKTSPDAAPDVQTRTWTDPATGRSEQVPEGVDPGWGYNVGKAYVEGDDLERLK